MILIILYYSIQINLLRVVINLRGDPNHYFIDQKGMIRVAKFGYGSIETEEEVRAIVDDMIRRK